ncbi:hypothetical protein PYCCODRAFT_1435056 [Trametes coccinea BRFM310]|uniref:CoA-dependent acyltransferase n=1 Tax=Trametes coccinea (strain BRFM310) TaxID=1353009 RepID=A0A1Y2INT6_TRAC3|nr:hypothetical protein PYCCODRAFT_1435056 [Trametes coccinea BRFM310]
MPESLAVEPRQPTVLSDRHAVQLPGYDLWMNYIENVLIIPARLDVPKFADALAETLRMWPHAAGHLHKNGDRWEIVLSNAGIPIETTEEHAAQVAISNSWVLQENLRPFLPKRGSPNPFATPVATTTTDQTKMLLFKLTLAGSETAVGVSWHHTLGDAFVLERFMRKLSEQYQGRSSEDIPTPTFDKRAFPAPTGSLIERYAPLMPHLVETYSVSEVGKRYADLNADTTPVRFKISQEQLNKLKDKVAKALGQIDVVPTSQDVLTAYVVSVLNRCTGIPIKMITNAASYRHVPDVLPSPDVAGNAVYIVPTALSRAPLSMTGTAAEVRRSIQLSRSRSFVEEYMTAASALMLEAVNNHRAWVFVPRPEKLSVNSNSSINWQSAHFGYPGTTRFHTSGLNDHYMRVFPSNPESSNFTTSTVSSAESATSGSLDVFFSVSKAFAGQVSSLIQSELNGRDFPDNIPDV